ncbi:hypothetical protein [Bacillus sp. NEAU-Y102]
MYEVTWSAQRTINSLEKANIDVNRVAGDAKLFLYNLKPALLVKSTFFYAKSFMASYPSITLPQRGSVILFQDGQVMQEYVNNVARVVKSDKHGGYIMDYDNGKLGTVLGYPPFLSDIFNQSFCQKEGEKEKWFGIQYHGYHFGAPGRLVIDSVNWMLENRPIPEELQTRVLVIIPSKENKKESKKVTFEEFKKIQESVVHN